MAGSVAAPKGIRDERPRSVGAGLRPVSGRLSLADHAYRRLRTELMEMDVYGGDVDLRLDERTLAGRLGISRTPLREAFTRLAQEGFVEIRARKGVFVKLRTPGEVLEMLVCWAALESMAARLVTEVASDEEIGSLRVLGVQDGGRSTPADIEEYSSANIRFHERILALSQCQLLVTTADVLLRHLYAMRRRAMWEGDRASRSLIDHTAIIDALERRQGDRAATLVREHTMRLHDHVRTTWLEREGSTRTACPAS